MNLKPVRIAPVPRIVGIERGWTAERLAPTTVSVWCHPVCKTNVAPPKRHCSATTTGSRIAQFHTKNGVLDVTTEVLDDDALLDT